MLAVYQKQRFGLEETFTQFITRHSQQLHQLFSKTKKYHV
jgi:hypothetical protein